MRLQPDLVLLDLDGTLVDSFPAITEALNGALAAVGLPARDLDWVRRHVGRGARALVADAAAGRPDAVDRLLAAFRRHYGARFLERTPPLPGVPAALAELARRSPLAVISNKADEWTRALLEHLGWDRLFVAVEAPAPAGARKPDPAMVRRALAAAGAAPGRSLLVGDMEVDVATAANAGVPMVAVASGARSAGELRRAGAPEVLPGVAALPARLDAGGPLPPPAPASRRMEAPGEEDHGQAE